MVAKMLSSRPRAFTSTQMVMARGSHTSRPVRMYFFTKLAFARRQRERGRGSMAGAGAAAATRTAAVAAPGARGRSRFSGGRGRRRGGAAGFGRPILEVGGIPTRPFELEARGGQLFAEGLCLAGGAGAQSRVGHLLQHILGMATGCAAVRVDRHRKTSGFPVGTYSRAWLQAGCVTLSP